MGAKQAFDATYLYSTVCTVVWEYLQGMEDRIKLAWVQDTRQDRNGQTDSLSLSLFIIDTEHQGICLTLLNSTQVPTTTPHAPRLKPQTLNAKSRTRTTERFVPPRQKPLQPLSHNEQPQTGCTCIVHAYTHMYSLHRDTSTHPQLQHNVPYMYCAREI